MKKIMLLIISCLMLLSCGKTDEVSNKNPGSKNSGTNETYKIGITQIATHPSLDLVKQGFKKAFEDAGIKAEFDEKNAEGTIANATLIANGYKSDKKNLVLGIGTPSAQALVNTITDMPVLFSAVTDPESAKLLNKNVTGTSDRLDNVGEQLDLLLKLKPEIKKIAVLYNPSEQNSVVQVKEIEAKAKEKNLVVMLQGVSSLSELPQATKNALIESDALYLPTDNLVVSGIKLITSEAKSAKKPVVSSENSSVEAGALFTMGLDYFELGKRTGEMAIEILKGKPAEQIPYELSKKMTLYVNETTAIELGLDLKKIDLTNAKIYK